MSPEEISTATPEEVIPEPEDIVAARKIIANIASSIDRGEVESISCYVELRNGAYRNYQSSTVGRHEDAGRIFELALLRLGFVQKEIVVDMIDEAL